MSRCRHAAPSVRAADAWRAARACVTDAESTERLWLLDLLDPSAFLRDDKGCGLMLRVLF